MLTVYRGDTRNPEEIIAVPGFKAWQVLTSIEARNVLRKFCGDQKQLPLGPAPVKNKLNRLRAPKMKFDKKTRRNIKTGEYWPLNPLDLSRLIKAQKTRDAFWISTDPTEGCGGYASGFIYKIQFDALKNYKINSTSTGIMVKPKQNWPSLWLDKIPIGISTIFALESKGNAGPEISFLTSIPLKCIKELKPLIPYKIPEWFEKSSNSGWWMMPHRPKVPSRVDRKKIS
jgi:hypothetical protein